MRTRISLATLQEQYKSEHHPVRKNTDDKYAGLSQCRKNVIKCNGTKLKYCSDRTRLV